TGPEVGPRNYSGQDGEKPMLAQRSYSEATAKLIDEEMKRIVEECFTEANRLLNANRDRLDKLAEALLEHDSLEEKEILEVTGLTPPAVGATVEGRTA